MAPWLHDFLAHVWNFKLIHPFHVLSARCIPSRKQLPFLSSPPLQFSQVPSPLSASLSFTLLPFQSEWTLFSVLESHSYSSLSPRTITLSLLCPPPAPAASTYSSSQSQPKNCFLRSLSDFTLHLYAPKVRCISQQNEISLLPRRDHICLPHHGFPNTQWIFRIGGAQ